MIYLVDQLAYFISLSNVYNFIKCCRYVSPQNPTPNWARCYTLMLQSLSGHNLALDPVEMRQSSQGWPALQIQLLQVRNVFLYELEIN